MSLSFQGCNIFSSKLFIIPSYSLFQYATKEVQEGFISKDRLRQGQGVHQCAASFPCKLCSRSCKIYSSPAQAEESSSEQMTPSPPGHPAKKGDKAKANDNVKKPAPEPADQLPQDSYPDSDASSVAHDTRDPIAFPPASWIVILM